MEEMRLADKYAKALISVAKEANLIEQIDKELAMFEEILQKQPRLCEILLSPIISFTEKEKLLQPICKEEKASPEFKRFLHFLLKMRRFNLFGQISQIYKDLIYSLRKRLKVFVEAAFSLDAKQKKALQNRLVKIYQRNINLFVRVEPKLIGGARVYVGHTLYDGTVKTKLLLLRQRLWKE